MGTSDVWPFYEKSLKGARDAPCPRHFSSFQGEVTAS
jgi:hypothetical protein